MTRDGLAVFAIGFLACENGGTGTRSDDAGPVGDRLDEVGAIEGDTAFSDAPDPGGDLARDIARDESATDPVGEEVPTDLSFDSDDDNPGADANPDEAATDQPPSPPCEDPVAFFSGPYGTSVYDRVPPFTLPTTDGVFDFQAAWTGCDSHFFVVRAAGYDYSEGLWKSNPRWLFEESPRNAHFFFLSADATAAADVAAMRASVEAAWKKLPPADAAWWAARVHFVPVPATQLPGFVGDVLRARGYFAFAIDRFQRLREVGLLMNIAWDQVNPQLMYLANEVRAFDFERDRQARMDAEAATVLTVFNQVVTQGGAHFADVVFPEASEMAVHDSLDVDLFMDCGDPASCEWDYLASLYLCDREDPERCDTEIARWVTTYGRDGRWVTDISPMLAFLKDGGPRRFRFDSSGQSYVTTMRLRLLNRGKGARPVLALPLFRGSAPFNLDYNSCWAPVSFEVPEGVKRAEIVALITGHGFGNDQANCAEFCNHTHHFRVNGGPEHVKEHPMAGTLFGCQDQVPVGVVPNQFGTWSLGRGGWCPGFDVKPWVADVTADLGPGGIETVTYRALFQGRDYDPQPIENGTGFSASILITSYLIFWK